MAKKEKKLLFIMGDFNFNLLNYESHTETNDFLKFDERWKIAEKSTEKLINFERL